MQAGQATLTQTSGKAPTSAAGTTSTLEIYRDDDCPIVDDLK